MVQEFEGSVIIFDIYIIIIINVEKYNILIYGPVW